MSCTNTEMAQVMVVAPTRDELVYLDRLPASTRQAVVKAGLGADFALVTRAKGPGRSAVTIYQVVQHRGRCIEVLGESPHWAEALRIACRTLGLVSFSRGAK